MHVHDNASKVISRACFEPVHQYVHPLLLILLLVVVKRSLRNP